MMNKERIKILVIEDDATIREGIITVLKKDGYRVFAASDGMEGSRLFTEQNPDLIITDLKLPGKTGMQLLNEFTQARPGIAVILISAYGTIDLAVNALQSGARDFIAKPFSIDELRKKIAQILDETKVTVRGREPEAALTFHGMIGTTPPMVKLFNQVRQVARVESPVLITGESGTGKELVARAIHSESTRKNQSFLAVNCGGFTETLLASELFGHEKGAFTGAVSRHLGIFEQADRGTILLDEIGEVSVPMQVQLLRVLQHQTFHRVGGTKEIKTNVRILAATNKDLKQAIKKKEFREDLYFRLSVLPLEIPALRDRREDIPQLVKYIVRQKCKQLDKNEPEFALPAIEKIKDYSWPGNIRELENFLERLLIFSDKKTITSEDIYFEVTLSETQGKSGSLNEVLEKTEREMIVDALEKSGGIKQRAAKKLGIKTSTLYYKMEKYNIREAEDF